MKRMFCSGLLLLVCACTLHAQTAYKELLIAFRITDYMVPNGDSVTIVQVHLPANWPKLIAEKQIGIIKDLADANGAYDDTKKASGRCQLIKGEYYYFGMMHKPGNKPEPGDLLYTWCNVPIPYHGLLFATGSHAIRLLRVEGDAFYDDAEMFTMDKAREDALLDSLVGDIRYTGKAMVEQMPDNNPLIKDGRYAGKKLFDMMQVATRNDLKDFLRYIEARPAKYAGHDWKVSEIFATWVVGGAPTVVEEKK